MNALAYYNENDSAAAAWLRVLIAEGHIAPGVVDERSITEVQPSELVGFTQVHFFAGIGGWSAALRAAGWPDDRPVWTGSCPCQPFSDAGRGEGLYDPRHLWPDFFRLIRERRPATVFGEQVASKAGRAWLDVVCADLERAGYAVGKANLAAASVGAPHIRQRLYWVADANRERRDGRGTSSGHEARSSAGDADSRTALRLADDDGAGRQSAPTRLHERWEGALGNQPAHRQGARRDNAAGCSDPVSVEHAERARLEGHAGDGNRGRESGRLNADATRPVAEAGAPDDSRAHHSAWGAADWLLGRDGKWRPVEAGTFPLAHGIPARVGRLRGYGNAIVIEVAQAFIEAYDETLTGGAV